MYQLCRTEMNPVKIDGLTSADLFGEDDEAHVHVLVHLLRKGDSRCAVLLDTVIPNVLKIKPDPHHHEEDYTAKIDHNLELWFYHYYYKFESVEEETDGVWIEEAEASEVDHPRAGELPPAVFAGLHRILDGCASWQANQCVLAAL